MPLADHLRLCFMHLRLFVLLVCLAGLVVGGCNFGNNKDLKDPNRDSTSKAQKAAGGGDDSPGQ